MGQQQLLLVILVTILVGIATVVALNVFGDSAQSANRDAVRQDLLGGAATAQGFYIRPEIMGGGENSFVGIELNDLNIPGVRNLDDDPEEGDTPNDENQNGKYSIELSDATTLTIRGIPSGSTDDYIELTLVRDGSVWNSTFANQTDD